MTRLLVAAGEASGDLHAARLTAALREEMPDLEIFGLGGDEMAAAGVELLAPSRDVAVVGITEILKILPRARQVFRALKEAARDRRPDAALLVDFPEFNLRLAGELKRLGVPVIYYVSPQVWAWRRWRVRSIAARVDLMLVLFPFEVAFYREHDVPVVHVGHPLVDEVPQLPQIWDRPQEPGTPRTIVLLPGSRRSEVDRLLPDMLGAARLLDVEGGYRFRLVRASTIDRAEIDAHLEACPVPVEVVEEDRFEAVADAHLALCASGTATLEVGLLGTPLVVVYRLAPWTYRIARRLVRLPSVSLVNLVLGEAVVPELIQAEAEAERIASVVSDLLADEGRITAMRERLGQLRPSLGASGATRRAAAAVAQVLESAG